MLKHVIVDEFSHNLLHGRLKSKVLPKTVDRKFEGGREGGLSFNVIALLTLSIRLPHMCHTSKASALCHTFS